MHAPPRPPAVYRTVATNNYGVEFSPFVDGLIAVASSQYFGIVGNGSQIILRLDALTNELVPIRRFDTQDGIFDCSWSENNEHQLVSACGDGSLKLFDLNTNDGFPLVSYKEHTAECASVDYDLVRKECFVSASWDHTLKLWDINSPRSIRTFADHGASVYNAQWSPRRPGLIASCSGDGTFKIWDVNSPGGVVQSVAAHAGEVLALDWSKYAEFMVVTGATDRTIRAWDLRRPNSPLHVLGGHDYAIRRLKTSPHDERLILSCSYDMTAKLWNLQSLEDAVIASYEHHTEFVMGVDFNVFRPNQLATCAWDEYVSVFDASSRPPRLPPQRRAPPGVR